MLVNLYSVFDQKAEAYLPPFCSQNDATATRQFSNAVSLEDHDFHNHAEDYSLWIIGTFDQAKGLLIKQDNALHTCIAYAHELLAHLENTKGQTR